MYKENYIDLQKLTYFLILNCIYEGYRTALGRNTTRSGPFRCGSSAEDNTNTSPPLHFLSVSGCLSPGFPWKMPQENIQRFQLASEVSEQRNESAELMKLRSELCKYHRKEFANICSNESLELVSIVPTSQNVSCTLSWSTCTNEPLFKRIFRQSVIKCRQIHARFRAVTQIFPPMTNDIKDFSRYF